MKKIIFFILTIILAPRLFAQAEPPQYLAVANQLKKFYNANAPDSIFNNFSAEMRETLPQDKFRTTTTQLKAQFGQLEKTELIKYNKPLAVYKATFKNAVVLLNISLNDKDQYTGLLLSPYQETAKAEQAKIDPSLVESPILLKTFSATISGTLAMPKNASGKIPVVLIIAGYGAVDRNGNGPNQATNDYKLMTEALGKNGIASVRYDKRGVGESINSTKEDRLFFDDFVDDAISLINLLNDDKRFSKVIVLGHGEGSLVGIMATIAVENKINAFISVEGAGRSGDQLLNEQMKTQPQYIQDNFKIIMDSLKRGRIQPKVDPGLYGMFKPSNQRFVMTWCRFDPAKAIKDVKVPILIVQGTTDLQISLADADKLKSARSNAVLTIVHGMNYVLKEAPADKEKNRATYNQPELPLKPELVTSVLDFIQKLK